MLPFPQSRGRGLECTGISSSAHGAGSSQKQCSSSKATFRARFLFSPPPPSRGCNKYSVRPRAGGHSGREPDPAAPRDPREHRAGPGTAVRQKLSLGAGWLSGVGLGSPNGLADAPLLLRGSAARARCVERVLHPAQPRDQASPTHLPRQGAPPSSPRPSPRAEMQGGTRKQQPLQIYIKAEEHALPPFVIMAVTLAIEEDNVRLKCSLLQST